ncbi:Chromate, partial [Rhizoctonia solani]
MSSSHTPSRRSNTRDVLLRTFDLGFTAFGGPPAHFQILHKRFVEGSGRPSLISEQTYQELFSISQALPGPASTKMTFCIAFLRAGFLTALGVFLIWSLPGAVGMYALSLGIEKVDEVLPSPVYALLSGLNASTVGIIALSAVQLARKAITDPLTRLLVLLSACAGLCYNALWYFPTLIAIGGCATLVWDHFLRGRVGRLVAKMRRPSGGQPAVVDEEAEGIPMDTLPTRSAASVKSSGSGGVGAAAIPETDRNDDSVSSSTTTSSEHKVPLKLGLLIIVGFFAIFTTLMVLRGTLRAPPLPLELFISMFLAGTIIFGGGPVVIPLLREYVVEPGWVSPRDFLIGLAIIQAFPGPNFNFAVYLGALALRSTNIPTIVGALLGFLGIFFPGITLSIGFQSIWRVMRSNRFVTSLLRGINAAAVGLVFTAVHRLWEIGYVKPDAARGVSLGSEPWWVVVAASVYVGVDSFEIPTPLGIMGGGLMGLAWYGAALIWQRIYTRVPSAVPLQQSTMLPLDVTEIAQLNIWEPWFKSAPMNQTVHRVNLAKAWNISQGSRILEIGCGQGDCTVVLASAVGDSGHVTGVDPAPLDYGAPATLGQAQSHLLKSKIGHRMSFVQADPIEFLKLGENHDTFDTAVLAHCIYYMSSPTVLLNTFRALFKVPSFKQVCVAEYALSASNIDGYPHVLAVLAQAMIEVHKDAEKSESNVRTVLGPEGISELGKEAGWLVSREGMIVPEKEQEDGRWEVGAVLEYTEVEIDRLILDERERALINGMKGSISRSVEELGGVKNVRTMDVWWTVLTRPE